MAIKLSKKTRAAFKQYYTNRKAQNRRQWDKRVDIQNIFRSLPKNCVYMEACAGTFFFTWGRPRIMTRHDRKNYWCSKIAAIFNHNTESWDMI